MSAPHPGNPYAAPPAPAGDPGRRPLTLTLAVAGLWLGALLSIATMVMVFTMDTTEVRQMMIDSMEQQPTYDPAVLDAESFADAFVPMIKVIGIASGLLSLGLWTWMAIINAKGRNWARITATVLGGLGLMGQLSTLGNLGANSAIGMQTAVGGGGIALTVVNVLLAIAILVLLWMPTTNAYVQAVTASKRQQQIGY